MAWPGELMQVVVDGHLTRTWELLDGLEGERERQAREMVREQQALAPPRRSVRALPQVRHRSRRRHPEAAPGALGRGHVRRSAVWSGHRGQASPLGRVLEPRGEPGRGDRGPDAVGGRPRLGRRLRRGREPRRPRSDARRANGTLSRILRAVALHHRLPCPGGRTFLTCWLAGTQERDSLADRLTVDPFMPHLLLHYLAAGECGDKPELPEVVAELVRRGAVERDPVLTRVLETLTGQQRPKSQQVLARTLGALDLQAKEVPGGLTYLLGVLSSSHRSVTPTLLPLPSSWSPTRRACSSSPRSWPPGPTRRRRSRC